MSRLRPDASFRWPTMEFGFALVAEPIDRIAARHGFSLESWDEDGLGPARGVALWLPSGRPILLRALEYGPRRSSATDPDVEIDVDAADLGVLGVEALLTEVLDELKIPRRAVVWVQDEHSQEVAAQRARWAVAYHAALASGEPPPEFPSTDEQR